MNKRRESGQVLVLASLMMGLFLGIAAFAVNASYAFYQHSRMQADLDLATKTAADGGDACSLLQAKGYINGSTSSICSVNGTGGTIAINNPPTTGSYYGDSRY